MNIINIKNLNSAISFTDIIAWFKSRQKVAKFQISECWTFGDSGSYIELTLPI